VRPILVGSHNGEADTAKLKKRRDQYCKAHVPTRPLLQRSIRVIVRTIVI
jgi:hypothetical protein